MNEKGDNVMRKSMIAVLLAGSMSLGACTAVDDARMSDVGTGAAIGAAGGAAVGALTGGVGVIEGAAVGAAIGGLAGAVWSDANNDGYVDGYTQNGTYYQGAPSGYDSTLGRVATGQCAN
ncbi:MAG TPA: YMGG-like glycine zipper-containing protein, partial [Sphingomicrobium sp.]|nr:YMGG-like glycine zipper-containing protein [Sphingomicrobium sp.]